MPLTAAPMTSEAPIVAPTPRTQAVSGTSVEFLPAIPGYNAAPRGASSLSAYSAPQGRPASVARAGIRTPYLDSHKTWLHQVRALEEPRHLLAGSVEVLLLARRADDILNALLSIRG